MKVQSQEAVGAKALGLENVHAQKPEGHPPMPHGRLLNRVNRGMFKVMDFPGA